jgi:hypothetical protein
MSKWDKREESGLNMIRDSDMVLEMLPKFKNSLILTSMLLLPTEL